MTTKLILQDCTLQDMQKNPDQSLDNIDWFAEKIKNSGEIYKNFVDILSQNPNEFKVSSYVEIMKFDHELGSILLEGVRKVFDKLQQIMQALQSSDYDKFIAVMYQKTEDEVKNMKEEEKNQFIEKSMGDLIAMGGKLQLGEKLMDISKSNDAYQNDLYSEHSIDQLLSSNLTLVDKKLFLDTKIEFIKKTLKGLDILVEESKDLIHSGEKLLMREINEGEISMEMATNTLNQSTTAMDSLDALNTKKVNSHLELLTLLMSKRKKIEE